MGTRRQGRESAFQLIYQLDLSSESYEGVIESFFLQMGVPHKVREFASMLVKGVFDHKDEIDAMITESSHHWKIHRMNSVDKNVLRLGIYELKFSKDTPTKVIINEAIEIGKKFGTEESGSFINGILDKIAKGIRGDEEEQA